jgi:hypothetical protein
VRGAEVGRHAGVARAGGVGASAGALPSGLPGSAAARAARRSPRLMTTVSASSAGGRNASWLSGATVVSAMGAGAEPTGGGGTAEAGSGTPYHSSSGRLPGATGRSSRGGDACAAGSAIAARGTSAWASVSASAESDAASASDAASGSESASSSQSSSSSQSGVRERRAPPRLVLTGVGTVGRSSDAARRAGRVGSISSTRPPPPGIAVRQQSSPECQLYPHGRVRRLDTGSGDHHGPSWLRNVPDRTSG